jgi:hypothetical protein
LTPPELGISVNRAAAAEAAAVGRADAAEARRRCLLVAVSGGAVARVPVFVLGGGGGTAPATGAAAEMTMNAATVAIIFLSLFSSPFSQRAGFLFSQTENERKMR